MAKRRSKAKRKAIQRRKKELRPSNRLSNGVELAEQGNLTEALVEAEGALAGANDEATVRSAARLVREIHFRLAARSLLLQERLNHLAAGDSVRADEPSAEEMARFTRERGLICLVLQRYPEALKAFTQDAGSQDPVRPWAEAVTLHLQGKAFTPTALSPEQQRTLQILGAVKPNQTLSPQAWTWADDHADPQTRALWNALLQMSEGASPLSVLTDKASRMAVHHDTARLFVDYYRGVAALRRRDHEAATDAWSRVQESGFSTPWFQENERYLLRREVNALAKQEQWGEILALFERPLVASILESDRNLQETVAYAHFYAGDAAARSQDWETAAVHWRRSAELNPNRYVAQNLALAEENLKQWGAAAEAWRDLLRRRPRKADHPDYFDEVQVAMLWKRASDCYMREYLFEDAETCLLKAIEYAPDRLDWRIDLADIYVEDERDEAAENELNRILQQNPNHISALQRLALLYDEQWDADSLPIYRRIWETEPDNESYQDDLAHAYAKSTHDEIGFLGRTIHRPHNETQRVLQEGLTLLPDHPLLLYNMGNTYKRIGRNENARSFYLQSVQHSLLEPRRHLLPLDRSLHQLLHVDGDKDVTALLPELGAMQEIPPRFWVEQGVDVINCGLPNSWIERFWEIALEAAQMQTGSSGYTVTFSSIFDAIGNAAATYEQNDKDLTLPYSLIRTYLEKARKERPHGGLVSYGEGVLGAMEGVEREKLIRLFRKAKREAEAAQDQPLAAAIEGLLQDLSAPLPLLRELLERFGDLNDFDDRW
ncbi:MAG: tetratricopeptide repeat protein [Caldilineaceae bacterium]|nr:tetratricopeptide repeat protein [Caldilineaceae bacterium]